MCSSWYSYGLLWMLLLIPMGFPVDPYCFSQGYSYGFLWIVSWVFLWIAMGTAMGSYGYSYGFLWVLTRALVHANSTGGCRYFTSACAKCMIIIHLLSHMRTGACIDASIRCEQACGCSTPRRSYQSKAPEQRGESPGRGPSRVLAFCWWDHRRVSLGSS